MVSFWLHEILKSMVAVVNFASETLSVSTTWPMNNDELRNSTINSTNSQSDYDINVLKIVSLAFSLSMAPLIIYVIIAIGYHGYKSNLAHEMPTPPAKRAASVFNFFIFVDAIFTLGFLAAAMPQVVTLGPAFCPIQEVSQIIFYAIAIVSVYLALWYRVYGVLYTNQFLKKHIPKFLRIINISCLVFLFMCVIVIMGFFFSSPRNVLTSFGCARASGDSSGLGYILLVVCMVAFQISLLISFICPLYMHKRRMLDHGLNVTSIMSVVKRSAIVVGVSVPSDIMAAFVSVFYIHEERHAIHIAYSINLIINLFGGILSSADWKMKLMPFRGDTSPIYSIESTHRSQSTVTGRLATETTIRK